MTEWRFIEPLDVLFPRGNKLFAQARDHGAAQMPPWPSVFAGALRSRMLADAGADLAAFAAGRETLPPALDAALGTPAAPGRFRLTAMTLARRVDGKVAPLFRPTADLMVTETKATKTVEVALAHPVAPDPCLASSAPLPLVPVARQSHAEKPAGGRWLTAEGFCAWLQGAVPAPEQVIKAPWRTDPRLGIALDGARGTVRDGMLYTVDAISMNPGYGFLVGIDGADGLVPADGLLRLGGDGRAARIARAGIDWPAPDWARIEEQRRCRVVLLTPGLFAEGWRPFGVGEDLRLALPGLTGRLVAAAFDRSETVSGWDLAKAPPNRAKEAEAADQSDRIRGGRPKPAQQAVPAGAVYWFDALDGDVKALAAWAAGGLWPADGADAARRAEGWNAVAVAPWAHEG